MSAARSLLPISCLSASLLAAGCGVPESHPAPWPADAADAGMLADAPATTRIADVRGGIPVRLEGEVMRRLDRDAFRFTDGTRSIEVAVDPSLSVPLEPGERLVVEGVVVDRGAFGFERPVVRATALVLSSGARIEYPLPSHGGARSPGAGPDAAASGTATAADVTPIADLRRGAAATVRGTVVRLLDTDEFRLEDASGTVRVYAGWRTRLDLRPGETVTVSGIMDDDPWPLRPELYATSIVRDGAAAPVAAPMPTAPTLPVSESPRVPDATDGGATAAGPGAIVPIASLRPGDMVAVRGTIERITDDDEFRLADETASIGVYVGWRHRVPAPEGERVTVIGRVDAQGPGDARFEIYATALIRQDGRIVELQRPGSTGIEGDPVPAVRTATAGTVATGPDPLASLSPEDRSLLVPVDRVRRGRAVVLDGTVQRLRDEDEFILRDETGAVEVFIGWRNRMPVRPGDRVIVIGVADDDVFPGFRPDVDAHRLVLSDGRTIELVHDDG